MAQEKNIEGFSVDELRQKYQAEQVKRLRPDGFRQYKSLENEHEKLDVDLFADPDFNRAPITEETQVVIVGGGFAGMLTGINLTKLGIRNFRIVEKAGDFGGTWYWNRYPGCMCDVESYTYLPLLEETGFIPTEKYSSASEIFEYSKLLARTFDLYPRALFQTVITGAEWNEDKQRWRVGTSRGDEIFSKYIVVAGGILHKPKLPGIPGIETFAGKMFHTSRWDYGFTGGGPTEVMDKLGDKRVGIIGTGATAVQAVPKLAQAAKELYVFQRTPSAVGVRNNGPTDQEWFQNQKPGWQAERIKNFTQAVTGAKPERNLVNDGWTDVMWENTQAFSESTEKIEQMELSDFNTMGEFRLRIEQIIDDPKTAEKLKPWYGKNCKRPCFHDDYLPAFNQPNVHLVDTDGKGISQITATGAIVNGTEYPLDCLVLASGFETATDYDSRVGFDPIGRDGVALSERWSQGARTLHGVLAGGFPNLMIISLVQAAYGTNFVHFLSKSAEHITSLIATCENQNIETIEASTESEDDWLRVLYREAAGVATYFATCTPGYYSSEMTKPDAKSSRALVFSGSLLEYIKQLEQWREQGEMVGAVITKLQ